MGAWSIDVRGVLNIPQNLGVGTRKASRRTPQTPSCLDLVIIINCDDDLKFDN
jgi:hypothetical protein